MLRVYVALLLLILVFISCVKEGEVDRIPPDLKVISWSPEPTPSVVCGSLEQVVFRVSDLDTIKMLIEFLDAGGLSEVKIDIHNNFDCHGHRSDTRDWLLQKIIPLSGSKQIKEITLPVPQNATAGSYHFGLLVSDMAGNVTDQTFFYSVQIVNHADTIPPVMQVISPDSDELIVTRGEEIQIEVFVEDNRPLYLGGNAKVLVLFRRGASGNILIQERIDLSKVDSNTSNGNLTFAVPSTWPKGNYDMILIPYDGVRNEGDTRIVKMDVQ
jgi:hypothetical protein